MDAAARRHRRGLTLPELLLLTLLMTGLALFLLPVGAKVRNETLLSTCTAHFQQYSRAFGMYCQDYDETFPPEIMSGAYRPGELNVISWDLLLFSDLKDPAAARCPQDPAPAFFQFRDGTRIWRSYATPRNLIWFPDPSNPRAARYPMKRATVAEPAATLMLLEKNQGAAVNGWPYPRTLQPRCWPCAAAIENAAQCAWAWHGGWVHALFVDGHARALAGPRSENSRFSWPHLNGYVFRTGAGTVFDRRANGDQFWEFCPLPGEPANPKCQP